MVVYLLILGTVAAWKFIPRPWHPSITLQTGQHLIYSTATRQQTEETARTLELLYQTYSNRLSILDENGNKQRFEPNSVTDPLSQYLLVTLRRDASAFKGSVNNIVIYYNGGTGYETVPPCINGNDPLLGLGDRCVYDRRVFKRGDPEVVEDPALLGDAQVRVLAKQNGEWFW